MGYLYFYLFVYYLSDDMTYFWLFIEFFVAVAISAFAFSALTPLAGHQEEHPACKN